METDFKELRDLAKQDRRSWAPDLPEDMPPVLPMDDEERKQLLIYDGFIKYFPRAIVAVTKQSLDGREKYWGKDKPVAWDRSKSPDELNSLMRHLLDGHWAKLAWRAMSNLEKQIENGYDADAEREYK